MPTLRAKFTVRFKEQQSKDSTVIKLEPVIDGSEENKQFFSATPGGHISLAVVSPAAADLLELGKEYYVDFTPADAPPAA